MGKTYRKARSERPNKIKRRWKEFRVKRKIIKEQEEYEQTSEMSEMSNENLYTNK
ncbi:uncharacterized protein METZ01_LOCUS90717 [marine metagenome]|uniref:Uncharacterized protein n=1 Tax=marine metagenome TaxID=408172 RepID=A0A381VEN9_9ZZZZ